MFRQISILISVAGLALALYVVATATEAEPVIPPAQPPSSNPFERGLVALGVVEPASRIIDVSAPEPGRVVSVLVRVNDPVKKGEPLFTLDALPVEAELVQAKAALEAAAAEVRRLENWPRPEDFPPAEAEATEARERLADAQSRLESIERAEQLGGVSDDEFARQRFLVSVLRASLANAEARLARLKAGSWGEDLAVARAVVAAREADIRAIEMRLDRHIVRAPMDATVLKRNVEPGEYTLASGGSGAGARGESGAPLILGDLSEMHVRAQVDEEDMPLLREGASAVARIRGPLAIEVPLAMVRIEPLAAPKSQITGSNTELIDTRVIEVVFRAAPPQDAPRLYPGQVVDVYIDVPAGARVAAAGAAPVPSGAGLR
ncbi:MAG: biotin/lipoyl-binding protein [Planctomycetota bacterium]|nr:biotin/lipoyl-binding protein [Planctomycetota bacterium]